MERKIEEIVNGMLGQMIERGAREATIRNYRDALCRRVVRYCLEHGTGCYSPELLENYLDEQKLRRERGEISKSWLSYIIRANRLLQSYAESGTADFSSAKPARKYIPRREYQELADELLEKNQIAVSRRKYLNYYMRHFFCFMEEQGLELAGLTDDFLLQFLDQAKITNRGSMGAVVCAVGYIVSYLKENHIAKLRLELSKLPRKRSAIRVIPPYSQDEISAILSVIDNSAAGLRDRAIILLALHTGLRAGDIVNLELGDIDWESGVLSIVQKKTRRPLQMPLNGTVMNSLADYILQARTETSSSTKLFLTATNPAHAFANGSVLTSLLDKYCKKAGIEKKPLRGFHSLRRTFATELSLQGIPLEEISEMLGHRQLSSDKPYLSYNRDQIAFCSIDFSEIPLTSGVYGNGFSILSEGGEKL